MFPVGSPCLTGHFPGNPVVPAVAILADLVRWTEGELGRGVTGVKSARFRKPLLPDDRWRVTLEEADTDEVTIRGYDHDRVVMNARLTLEQE